MQRLDTKSPIVLPLLITHRSTHLIKKLEVRTPVDSQAFSLQLFSWPLN